MINRRGEKKCAFRLATSDEINAVLYKDYKSTFSEPKHYNPCVEINLPTSETKATSHLFADETKVSYESKRLVANKIENSNEINDFLLIS